MQARSSPTRSFAFWARYAQASLFALFAAMLLVVVVAPGASPAVRGAFLAAALPFAWLAVRSARLAVLVGDDGVRVRNTTRTVAIPWNDVEAFEAARWLRGTPYEIGAVRRRGGERVLALGLTPPFGDPAALYPVIDELERERVLRQSAR